MSASTSVRVSKEIVLAVAALPTETFHLLLSGPDGADSQVSLVTCPPLSVAKQQS